jgi:hypothetical protein
MNLHSRGTLDWRRCAQIVKKKRNTIRMAIDVYIHTSGHDLGNRSKNRGGGGDIVEGDGHRERAI